MAWINLGDVRFRHSLPRSGKARYIMKQVLNEVGKFTPPPTFDNLLLKDNIPAQFKWSNREREKERTDESNKVQAKTVDGDEFWTYKETSCDVELDTVGMKKSKVTYSLMYSDIAIHFQQSFFFIGYHFIQQCPIF